MAPALVAPRPTGNLTDSIVQARSTSGGMENMRSPSEAVEIRESLERVETLRRYRHDDSNVSKRLSLSILSTLSTLSRIPFVSRARETRQKENMQAITATPKITTRP